MSNELVQPCRCCHATRPLPRWRQRRRSPTRRPQTQRPSTRFPRPANDRYPTDLGSLFEAVTHPNADRPQTRPEAPLSGRGSGYPTRRWFRARIHGVPMRPRWPHRLPRTVRTWSVRSTSEPWAHSLRRLCHRPRPSLAGHYRGRRSVRANPQDGSGPQLSDSGLLLVRSRNRRRGLARNGRFGPSWKSGRVGAELDTSRYERGHRKPSGLASRDRDRPRGTARIGRQRRRSSARYYRLFGSDRHRPGRCVG